MAPEWVWARGVSGVFTVAGTAMHVLAVGYASGTLAFASGDAKASTVASGAFPVEAQAAKLLVVADYALLGRTDLRSFSTSGELGVLAPIRAGNSPDPADALGADTVLRLWFDSDAERLQIPFSRLPRVARFLGARSSYTALMHQTFDQVSRLLSALSPEYFDALSERGRLQREALGIVSAYPTPAQLQSASTLQLTHALDTLLPRGRSVIRERVFELHQKEAFPEIDPYDGEFAMWMIPSWVRDYTRASERRTAIDQEIHRLLGLRSTPRAAPSLERDFSVLGIGLSPDRTVEMSHDADALLVRLDALLAERFTADRHAQSAYEEYKLVHDALEQGERGRKLDLAERIRIETAGQLLALSSGRYLEAIRYRRACGELFETAAEARAPIDDRVRADAAIAMALTEVVADDMVGGFAALRGAIEGSLAGAASPEFLTEALGMFVLTLVLFGENENYPQAFDSCAELIARHGASGPSRAAFDIAELFIASGKPLLAKHEFEEFRSIADANSRDTAYRSYYHYVMMLTPYVSTQYESALTHYADLKREALLPRFNRRFHRLSRLSYALNLAGKGEFALAHRELADLEGSADRVTDGADELILALTKLRLELAAGEHRNALAQTMPDGPLGEEQIIGVHLRRYVPCMLCIRGTALMREGAVDLAEKCFLRATQHSIASGEWLGLLCVETAEYREWLAGLDRAHLPEGVTDELLDALLARPLFIGLTLPCLTPQQRRVLRLLAQGRSTNSIASELHVSPNTLKSHLRELYRRLDVRSREQAVLQAESYGMLR